MCWKIENICKGLFHQWAQNLDLYPEKTSREHAVFQTLYLSQDRQTLLDLLWNKGYACVTVFCHLTVNHHHHLHGVSAPALIHYGDRTAVDNWEADGLQWTLCSGDYNYDDHHLFSGHCAVYRWSPVQGRKGRFRADILGSWDGFSPAWLQKSSILSISFMGTGHPHPFNGSTSYDNNSNDQTI